MPEQIVIVGAGQGGFQAAASLRQNDSNARITLIGDEPGLPYQRPPLSKSFMKDGDPARLLLRPKTFFEKNQINLVEKSRVSFIDRAIKEVETKSGRRFPYDHLILATGARNTKPPIRNVEADGLHDLRTLADATAMRSAVVSARHAVVIGGGFIGLEFAAQARAAGIEVTVVEMAPRLMARVVSPGMSHLFADMHIAMGTQLVFGQPAIEILTTNNGAASGVLLADGTELDGDMVLLASGVQPNTGLAAAADLEIDNGIVVDHMLQTADPAIFALGDCAAFPESCSGKRIRLESVQAATDQARAIARNLTGNPAAYDAIAWFWSDQADWKLQIAGLPKENGETHLIRRNHNSATALWFSDGILTCAETVNAAGEHMAARRLLASGLPVTRSDLEMNDYRLTDYLKSTLKAP